MLREELIFEDKSLGIISRKPGQKWPGFFYKQKNKQEKQKTQ